MNSGTVLRWSGRLRPVGPMLLCCLLAACRQDMHDQPKYKPLGASSFFADGRASRQAVAGTVARGHLNDDEWLFSGKKDGRMAADLPLPVNAELLARGRERYDIFCSPCHARTGDGDGMIVRRGFRRPPSLHDERLRAAPAGHFFDVITRGFGVMPDYAAQIDARDRWAIVAYIRALQLSRNATLADVPPGERERLAKGPAAESAGRPVNAGGHGR